MSRVLDFLIRQPGNTSPLAKQQSRLRSFGGWTRLSFSFLRSFLLVFFFSNHVVASIARHFPYESAVLDVVRYLTCSSWCELVQMYSSNASLLIALKNRYGLAHSCGRSLSTTKYLPDLRSAEPRTSQSSTSFAFAGAVSRCMRMWWRPMTFSLLKASLSVSSVIFCSSSAAAVSSRMARRGFTPVVSTSCILPTKCNCAAKVSSIFFSCVGVSGGGRADSRSR